MSDITVALAGNPNSGKTTLFNALTGAAQFVGNWPGVTVEKKEGKYKKDKSIRITDLPGIYSLSPYSQEEVVAREYLTDDSPDVIINIVDATNLERNLYLTTQILELGVPVVIALNMMDVVKRNGDAVYSDVLSKILRCPVVEISAQKEENIDKLMSAAAAAARKGEIPACVPFDNTTEDYLKAIIDKLPADIEPEHRRYAAIKLFERDEKTTASDEIKKIIDNAEAEIDDDTASFITGQRYDYITSIINKVRKKTSGKVTLSDKIDRVVTNRWLGLPVFALVMFLVYYVSVTTVGTLVTDWTNDVFVGELAKGAAETFLTNIGCAEWLVGLIVEGIIGGVGAMLGFMPQMFILFFFLALLEDCGYMARIAFVMDRVFRKFGMSGKSFIPMLNGTGCGLPGIMAARTIENEKDRRMTIMTVTFMPCGAKLPVIACIAGALFRNNGLVAFSAYMLGIFSVIVTGIMLKKTKAFAGQASPFVMELPAYHMPTVKNVWHSIWERLMGFAKKACTILILVCAFIWFLSSFGFVDGKFTMVEDLRQSVSHNIGNAFARIFKPCGFGKWQAVVSSIFGLAAKEEIVGVMGVFSSIGDADMASELVEEGGNLAPIAALFGGSALAGYAFLAFNLLCAPCLAAVNTIRAELKSAKWFLFSCVYQTGFAYLVSLTIYQLGLFFGGGAFTGWTAVAFALVILLIYMLCRKGYTPGDEKK
ncbi:MAG: ferrous iron transport protein B [Abditibacteriota bacterium]|nr:ferrous iron transport protein B [Abditibacteriota bacterium]